MGLSTPGACCTSSGIRSQGLGVLEGAAAYAGRPGWGWGRADAGRTLPPAPLGGPPVPWPPLWHGEFAMGPGLLVTDPGSFLGRSAGRALAAGLACGHSRSSRGKGGRCPRLPTTEACVRPAPPPPSRPPRGTEPVGAGGMLHRREGVGAFPGPGPGAHTWAGPPAHAESRHADKPPVPSTRTWPHPREPPVLVFPRLLPTAGPCRHPIGPWEALPHPHSQLEKPVLHAHPLSALHSPSVGRTST